MTLRRNARIFQQKNLQAILTALLSEHGISHYAFAFIAAKILSGGSSMNTKDHWVVLANKIKVNGREINENSPMNGIITSEFFIVSIPTQTTLGIFLSHFYGGLVFQPIE